MADLPQSLCGMPGMGNVRGLCAFAAAQCSRAARVVALPHTRGARY